MKIWNFGWNGVYVIDLIDVVDKTDLDQRIEKEDCELIKILQDVPFFAEPTEEISQKELADLNCQQLTYAEWITEELRFAADVMKEQSLAK